MRRRTFIAMLGGTAVVWPLSLRAQPAAKLPRVGFILSGTRGANARQLDAFYQGLRELGWIAGKNIAVEERYAEGQLERLPETAADLVRIKTDVILVNNGNAARAAKRATSAIPIVLAGVAAPVESGLVASLARPSGNITGLSLLSPESSGKRLQLLKQVVPAASRIAVFRTSSSDPIWKETEAAAHSVGVMLQPTDLRSADDIDSALSELTKGRHNALFVIRSAITRIHARRIVDFAARNQIPTMFDDSLYVTDGGLMSYGSNLNDVHRRAAAYVDKILKGARPGDLPIEQPTKFELVLNLKTAKTLGLTIPQELLLQASRVIE